MADSELALKKRVFFFGAKAEFHAFVHRGERGKWRWLIRNIDTDKVRCVSPVYGWESDDAAESDCREYHEALGVKVQEIK